MQKHYISSDQLLRDSMQLALKVIASEWHPTLVVGIWRGGAPVGVHLQEVLSFAGIPTDHFCIRTSSYSGIGSRTRIVVEGLLELVPRLGPDTKLLLVDDVHDTGLSLQQLQLEIRERHPQPFDMRTAVPYFKPVANRTANTPDYYVHSTEDWLVFPHEIVGLTDAEILECKPELGALAPHLLGLRKPVRKAS
jgi:hypoxanthine phosphoribosyltransferase